MAGYAETVKQADCAFRVKSGVVSTRVRESVVVLDRTGNRYVTLNGVASQIWEGLIEGQHPRVIGDRLAEEYDAPAEQIAADVARQVQDFLKVGFIEVGTPKPSDVPAAPTPPEGFVPVDVTVRLPSYFRCMLVITEIKLRLARQGYDRTLQWVERQVKSVWASTAASIEAVRSVEYRVAVAGSLYPGRALCLEQSLTLYLLLRSRGVAVRYRQGVRANPFAAHAWVEYLGDPVNDVDEHVRLFTPLPDQLA